MVSLSPRRILAAAALAGGTLLAGAAAAHDIWMVAAPGQSAEIVFGDLTGPTLADVKKIVSFDLVQASGTTDLRHALKETISNGHPVLRAGPIPAAPGAVIAVAYDNGFWARQPQDKLETNAAMMMIPKALSPHWTVKWGKMLTGKEAYRIVLNDRLELVALQDPYALAKGATLTVRLLLDGKPFAGAKIAYTNGLDKLPDPQQPTVDTDKDGVAKIPMPAAGPTLLTTDIEVKPAHPDLAEHDHLYASLAFDTAK